MIQLTDSYTDPLLDFRDGVAAIDVVTLQAAADKFSGLSGYEMVLPNLVGMDSSNSFDDLMQIEVDGPPLEVTATVDTKKMSWDTRGHLDAPQKATLTTYTNEQKRGVLFKDVWGFDLPHCTLASLPVLIGEGELPMPIWPLETSSEVESTPKSGELWVAEVDYQLLQNMTAYGLFQFAVDCMAQATESVKFDTLVIPAEQVRYTREMGEITAINPSLASCRQNFILALDETGVRMAAETTMRGAAAPGFNPAPERHVVLGSKGPVILWLTIPEPQKQPIPFAVIATKAESWVGPHDSVDFEQA